MNPWKVISEVDVESIHQATLRVLSEVGILLSHMEVKELLLDAGATQKDDRVLLSPELVEAAIASCTKKISTTGRNAEEIVLGDGTLQWHNLGGSQGRV